MNLRKQVLRGATIVTLGEVVGYAASFVRNMILARLLSKADYGMAAVFGMVMSLLEFTAKLSVGRVLVQDKEGEKPAFLATGHALQVSAGLVSAALIVCLAPWLARWFGIAEHGWALMMLGVVVLVRSLEHLDVRRFERNLRFGPSAAVEAVPQVVTTLAAWPLATWLGDYRAVLVLLITKAALGCAISHMWAEQRYCWGWQPEYGRRMVRFGWPLVLTGFLMFGIMQGDQFLVATYYSMADLAPYAAAVSLVMAPQFVVGRVFGSVALPLMARVQDDATVFAHRYRQMLRAMSLYAACSTTGMIVGAEAMMQAVYGPKYAGSGAILAWLAAVAGLRSLRVAVSTANLARGDSPSQLWSNLFRACSLFPAVVVALHGRPLWMIAACGVVGECVATLYCAWRLRQSIGIPADVTLGAALGVLGLAGLIGLAVNAIWGMQVWAGLVLAFMTAALTGGLVVGMSAILRSECVRCLGLARDWAKDRIPDIIIGALKSFGAAPPSREGMPWHGPGSSP